MLDFLSVIKTNNKFISHQNQTIENDDDNNDNDGNDDGDDDYIEIERANFKIHELLVEATQSGKE